MKIIFDKPTAQFVIEALNADTCSFCEVKLIPDNFAGATKYKYSCNSLPCLIELSKEIK